MPKEPLVGAHPRYPRYQDGACAPLRVALAYEVRKRREQDPGDAADHQPREPPARYEPDRAIRHEVKRR